MLTGELLRAAIAVLAVSLLPPATSVTIGFPVEWRLVEDLRIGAADGPLVLSSVLDVAATGSGGAIVIELQARRAIVVGADGSAVALGREGGGPGEFRRISRAGELGDTVWLWDGMLRRFSLFDLDGTFLTTRPIDRIGAAAMLRGGRTAMSVSATAVSPADRSRSRWLLLLHPEPAAIDTLEAWLDGSQPLHVRFEDGFIWTAPRPPFATTPLWAPAPDGAGVVVVDRSAGDESFALRRYNDAGRLVLQSRIPYRPVPLTRADIRNFTREYATGLAAGRTRLGLPPITAAVAERAVERSLEAPPYYPPVSSLFVAHDDRTWLKREERVGAAHREWWVVDPRGNFEAFVMVPATVELHAADATYVWASTETEEGIPQVIRYRIRRGGA